MCQPQHLTPPQIVSQEEWLTARKALLIKEKETTRAADALAAQIRDLPMVKMTKDYIFDSTTGKVTLSDMFDGHKQLLVYHFMFEPDADEGCSSCSFFGDHVPDLRHLQSRNTNFVAVSRAPIDKIEAFKKRMGWKFQWYSCFHSDFGFDFGVSQDEKIHPIGYNFMTKDELESKGHGYNMTGEQPGMSVFLKEGDDVFHTYSSYARGNEKLLGTYLMLDITPLGRQDKGEGLGFPYHDQYD